MKGFEVFSAIGKLLGQGFLFGFGFALSAMVAYSVFASAMVPSHKVTTEYDYVGESTVVMPADKEGNKISFHDVKERQMPSGGTYFTGVVKNDGSTTMRGFTIELNLFLKNEFVDQYTQYFSDGLKPGEERYFKVSCGCEKTPPAAHDSYKLSAIGGM